MPIEINLLAIRLLKENWEMYWNVKFGWSLIMIEQRSEIQTTFRRVFRNCGVNREYLTLVNFLRSVTSILLRNMINFARKTRRAF